MPEPRLLGKYELLNEIGRGGFASVYRARDTRMGREVALKVIHGNFAKEPNFVQRFELEVQTAARLRHPNIVTVHDYDDADGVLYLAMELIEGSSLRTYLDDRKRLTLDQALPILKQVADALDYLAVQQLVHRDIKPANVLLEGEDDRLQVKLTDFGLVRSLEASTQLTKSANDVLGTPAYMAPEQSDAKQWGDITSATDVYALGVVAYEMLCGRPPFEGETLTVMYAHAYDQPPSPLEFVPDLGVDLGAVLLRALNKSPSARYASARALVAAMQQVQQLRQQHAQHRSELAQLIVQAQAARTAKEWLLVQGFCVQIMQIDRAHPEALAWMSEAAAELQRENQEEMERRQRATRYEAGEAALTAGEWVIAIESFEEVAQGNPDFRDVQQKLAQARDELQCAHWYDEAIAHGEAQRWPEACGVLISLLSKQRDYAEGKAAERLIRASYSLLELHRVTNDRLSDQYSLMVSATWESLLYASANSKRSGNFNVTARRLISEICRECAKRRDVTPLFRALTYPDPNVRKFAARALGELGGRSQIDEQAIVSKLIQLITREEDIGVKWRAVWALGAIRPHQNREGVEDFLGDILEDRRQANSVRWRAAWALGEMKARRKSNLLNGVARDLTEVSCVRRAAIRSLGATPDPEIGRRLAEIDDQDDYALKKALAWAARECSPN
jgi:hypothetical protein